MNRLLFDFDGAEWDRLMLLLRHHGLVGFQSWDDDASRLFINSNAPSTLNSLALHDMATAVLLGLWSRATTCGTSRFQCG
jgi:hypothetical protein